MWLTAEEGSEVFAQGQYFSKVLYEVPLNGKCTRVLTFENWRKAIVLLRNLVLTKGLTFENWRKAGTSYRPRKRTMHVPCKREETGAWRKRRVDSYGEGRGRGREKFIDNQIDD